MRIPTRTLLAACTLSVTLLVTGCGGDSDAGTQAAAGGSTGELFLQPVAAQGPDPFTDSTATSTATPPPVTRTPQSTPGGHSLATTQEPRSFSGATPGLYGGTQSVGSCDVERQIRFLTADRAKAHAFAEASGISPAAVPGFLRGLTSVVLRADTRVTNHGFRDGRATSFQSVLQTGTAVLVDNRGAPRVRCACGNPLKVPGALRGNPGTQGHPWSGYRPAQVIVVIPAPKVIVNITIINIVDHTWIERQIGDDGHRDVVVPQPDLPTESPSPDDSSSSGTSHDTTGVPPGRESTAPQDSPSDCVTATATVTRTPDATGITPGTGSPTPGSPTPQASDEPTDCPTVTATVTAPPTTPPDGSLTPSAASTAPDADTTGPDGSTDMPPNSASQDIGPDTVPDSPDLRDGGGLIPDEPAATDSIFDTPTDVFGS
ncbi:DUF6777 domain-containing protein [Streptomyces sp. SAS_270]|uniref:DUF6777 domain-containing protein n=1 Tax=Streptomyces sp. SAS_270 TaxID=3412748 RepID=UPI00403CDDDF